MEILNPTQTHLNNPRALKLHKKLRTHQNQNMNSVRNSNFEYKLYHKFYCNILNIAFFPLFYKGSLILCDFRFLLLQNKWPQCRRNRLSQNKVFPTFSDPRIFISNCRLGRIRRSEKLWAIFLVCQNMKKISRGRKSSYKVLKFWRCWFAS